MMSGEKGTKPKEEKEKRQKKGERKGGKERQANRAPNRNFIRVKLFEMRASAQSSSINLRIVRT